MKLLRRESHSRYSVVEPIWANGTAVLIGGGPSLTVEQVELVRQSAVAWGTGVIAINDAYRLAPFADLCYFADAQWWRWHKDQDGFRTFQGQLCSISDSREEITDSAVHILRNANGSGHSSIGLSMDPAQIVTGRHSGFQALNIAVLAQAKTILLIGFDAREPTSTSKAHWFGEHPVPTPVEVYAHYRRSFSMVEDALKWAGVRVINCSPGSAINSFEHMDLADALRS